MFPVFLSMRRWLCDAGYVALAVLALLRTFSQ
ncbi:hypothetical protein HCH_03708 [Hahella chejuensis KCTC 2396]|uniref:Uncharacterized protein n=1 Tax=Hahella chejuensis (strain KCTC 2396) TaxID=349521 RepID=Q2SFX9_HAHCH|nr:hypothetical protein HCH_03708 [Hahella chejuensis KCTC 2396]